MSCLILIKQLNFSTTWNLIPPFLPLGDNLLAVLLPSSDPEMSVNLSRFFALIE